MKFTVFTDEAYRPLCEVLLDSLQAFSRAAVHVVAVNCELTHPHPWLCVNRMSWPTYSAAPFSTERLKHVINPRFEGSILIDADCVATREVDGIFGLMLSGRARHQPAPCGSWDKRLINWLGPRADYVYVNAVPMMLNAKTMSWLRQGRALHWHITQRYAELTEGGVIDDETLINCLRRLSDENETLPPCLANEQPCYFWHGEKDPTKARERLVTALQT